MPRPWLFALDAGARLGLESGGLELGIFHLNASLSYSEGAPLYGQDMGARSRQERVASTSTRA